MRVLSGMQPSGAALHLGNYFGALRQWVALQERYEETLFFIADYHSMNSVREADLRRQYTRSVALDYLGAGVDPRRAIVYRQSDVPEVCELAWMLMTVTGMGLFERAHAYKDKLAQGQAPDVGLFVYPALMAADILFCDADLVPVGQDQKQHIEMTRDMAQHFNTTYGGPLLNLPEPYILETVAVVPGTDGRKMSKSYGNTIDMYAGKKQVKKAVMGIVTDSTPVEEPKEPSGTVFQLHALFADATQRQDLKTRALAGGLGYGDAKKELLELLMDYFADQRARREDYEKRPDDVEDILADGARRARELAAPVMERCRHAAGLGPPARPL